MTVQRYQGSLRTAPGWVTGSPANCVDNALSVIAGQPAWTPGATLIDQLQIIPPFTQKWTLLSAAITAEMCFMEAVGSAWFGKFGAVRAGIASPLSQTLQQSDPSTTNPWTAPALPLPQDQSGIGTLWDPANDPLPPVTLPPNTPTRGLPVSLSIVLPTPIVVDQAEPLGVGIWMAPSLLGTSAGSGSGVLIVFNGSYSITYDDGAASRPTGYS